MKKLTVLTGLLLGLTLSLSSCGEDMPGMDTGLGSEDGASLPADGNTGTSTGTGSASTDNDTASANNPGGNKFAEFIKSGDTYFGPEGNNANLDVNLSGNAAAGSRFGGPDDAVGVLVVVRNNRGFMEVVNLENKNRFPVVFASNREPFSVAADTLGGKPFPSIFVGEISSLTQFKFDHRVSPSTGRCTEYTASFSGTVSDGLYLATVTDTDTGCRYVNSGV